MAWFGRNPNETAYVGGKKHWTDVIKNSGSGDLLIWRQPEEDFNTNSTLIVMPGEAAIFVNSGVIEQVFKESGTYKLSTENYPFISRLRNAFSGGISTFKTEGNIVAARREGKNRKGIAVQEISGNTGKIHLDECMTDILTGKKYSGEVALEPFETLILEST